MSTTVSKLVTADELLRMPDDGFRYELVRGDLKRMSPTGGEHGRITMRLASPLFEYVEARKLGIVYACDTGFKLESDPDTVRAPDIAFVSTERLQPSLRMEGYRGGAPDLAVEVLSPGNTKREMLEKINEYFETGSRMVWIVSPKLKTVAVYISQTTSVTLSEKDTLDGGDVVPGFAISVARIFDL